MVQVWWISVIRALYAVVGCKSAVSSPPLVGQSVRTSPHQMMESTAELAKQHRIELDGVVGLGGLVPHPGQVRAEDWLRRPRAG